MTPTARQLDGLIDLLVAAVLREMESPEKEEAATPTKDAAASGDVHGRDKSTANRCPGK